MDSVHLGKLAGVLVDVVLVLGVEPTGVFYLSEGV